MPDISMCTGDGCPRAGECYRKMAEPGYHQSYFVQPPLDRSKATMDCLYFMPVWKKAEK